jgi:hypothetical protein
MLAFHDELNPRIWSPDKTLRPEVRVRLLRTALAFYRFLDVRGLVISDIILTGSNAAFNYTDVSDVDLHLVVDYAKTTCPELAADFFDVKRVLWNQTHNAEIRGHKVELYVEDRANPAYASGVYSLLRNKWAKQASATRPTYDDAAVAQKTKALASEITSLLDGDPKAEDISTLLDRLREMRRSGLMAGGEFSVENTSFKGLRALGLISRLRQAAIDAQDRDLSLT